MGNLKRYFQVRPILKKMDQITVPRLFKFQPEVKVEGQ
jgi:hypothetical protein